LHTFGDTHIRLLKYHKEYREIFSKIYTHLKNEKVDYIIHCGDIFHNKTALSPEGIQLGAEFFQNLADIAPTYIIAGNHDLTLNNSSRLDALSPIVDAIKHSNLHYLKKSGEVEILNTNIVLNPLVITEEPRSLGKNF